MPVPDKQFYNGFEGGFSYEVEVPGDPTPTIETIDVDITDWSGEESNPSRDVTTTGEYDPATGRCFTARWHGRSSFTGQISLPVYAQLDFDAIRAGRRLRNVTLVTGGGENALTFFFPKAYIPTNQVNTGGMDDVTRYTLPFENDGIYYGPGDTIPDPEE